jgi:hypothetical protein
VNSAKVANGTLKGADLADQGAGAGAQCGHDPEYADR